MLRAAVTRRLFSTSRVALSDSSAASAKLDKAINTYSSPASPAPSSSSSSSSPSSPSADDADVDDGEERVDYSKYLMPEQPPRFIWKEELPQLAGIAVFGTLVLIAVLGSPSTASRERHH